MWTTKNDSKMAVTAFILHMNPLTIRTGLIEIDPRAKILIKRAITSDRHLILFRFETDDHHVWTNNGKTRKKIQYNQNYGVILLIFFDHDQKNYHLKLDNNVGLE